jgi:hypothetical protein
MPETARELETAIGDIGRTRRLSDEAAFRAGLEQRLLKLESDLGEVKLRLNGLLFFLASTVLGQVLLGLLA